MVRQEMSITQHWNVSCRLSDNGLRLNLAKCNFAKQSVSYLGYTWNSSGMRPGDEKLQAIKNMEKPKNGEELRAFLGLATYLGSNNVPHFSTLVNLLWSLPNFGMGCSHCAGL